MTIPSADLFYIDKAIAVPVAVLAGFVAGLILGRLVPVRVKRRPRSRKKLPEKNGGAEVYVGNLPYSLSENELRKTFSSYGDVAGVRIITNRGSGTSKGYGFVTMSAELEAKNAIQALNSKEIGGRRIVVNSARTSAR